MAVACAFLAAAAHSQSININSDLLAAARRGDTAGVRAVLEGGEAVNPRNRLGDSALLIAAKSGYTPMALLVLERGADVDQRNLSGVSALMAAAFEGNVELTRALLARGAALASVDRAKKTAGVYRSEERRVGKEGRSRGSPYH